MIDKADVVVVATGIANMASVRAGIARAGGQARLSLDPEEVRAAARVVLPGVGAFGAALEVLRARGLVDAMQARVRDGRATLAVCLGLQLLCKASEESPGEQGLGVVPGVVRRFPDTVRVPQLGWNRVEPDESCAFLQPGYAYFANSFRLVEPPPGWHVAFTEYGGPFVAAMERGAVLACQFHPELSGAWGVELLRRWLSSAEAGGSAPC